MRTSLELEAFGIRLSRDCDMDGASILEAAIEALTNVNFHAEADVLNQIADALNNANGEREIRYQLTITEVDNEIPF